VDAQPDSIVEASSQPDGAEREVPHERTEDRAAESGFGRCRDRSLRRPRRHREVLSGGFSSDGPVQEFIESRPKNDTTWSMVLVNFDDAAGHTVTLHAVCIK
jgi:hypothetical protein